MINDRHPTCTTCGEDLVYLGTHYTCEICNDVVEDFGGSLK